MTETKAQAKRREAYHRQLKKCGFRSWKRANQRRGELIDRHVLNYASPEEQKELEQLQRLARLYVKWKTNDEIGRGMRQLNRLMKKLEIPNG